VNAEGTKDVRFQWKTGHILETVRDIGPTLLLLTNRKSHTAF